MGEGGAVDVLEVSDDVRNLVFLQEVVMKETYYRVHTCAMRKEWLEKVSGNSESEKEVLLKDVGFV